MKRHPVQDAQRLVRLLGEPLKSSLRGAFAGAALVVVAQFERRGDEQPRPVDFTPPLDVHPSELEGLCRDIFSDLQVVYTAFGEAEDVNVLR